MYVCIYVCMHACMYVYACMCSRLYIVFTCTYADLCAYKYSCCVYINKYVNMCTYTCGFGVCLLRNYFYRCVHECFYVCVCIYIYVDIELIKS